MIKSIYNHILYIESKVTMAWNHLFKYIYWGNHRYVKIDGWRLNFAEYRDVAVFDISAVEVVVLLYSIIIGLANIIIDLLDLNYYWSITKVGELLKVCVGLRFAGTAQGSLALRSGFDASVGWLESTATDSIVEVVRKEVAADLVLVALQHWQPIAACVQHQTVVADLPRAGGCHQPTPKVPCIPAAFIMRAVRTYYMRGKFY